ncbi:hypothetical protein HYPSUDRAFT_198775 [Hypholoma sublateritium FD-334 SS-4]|uniref:Uncharacterized protein n=1 Tax=Hypholoma sublateritium (strain FD-334 SS-4) TaxID=945553 RepID=A0A0D2PD19_HYPSF|nr:hypothetical protein HYPSUDRAFT_198775 [Hypholoma sublateritium FD-334 SS-4]
MPAALASTGMPYAYGWLKISLVLAGCGFLCCTTSDHYTRATAPETPSPRVRRRCAPQPLQRKCGRFAPCVLHQCGSGVHATQPPTAIFPAPTTSYPPEYLHEALADGAQKLLDDLTAPAGRCHICMRHRGVVLESFIASASLSARSPKRCQSRVHTPPLKLQPVHRARALVLCKASLNLENMNVIVEGTSRISMNTVPDWA